MSEYSKIADRLERIKKSIAEEKLDNNKPNERDVNTTDDSEVSGAAFAIQQLITFNNRKELTNQSKDVLDEALGFPQYINAINSFKNPDILTGDRLKFLKGNKYRAKMANKIEDEKEEKLDNDKSEEEGQQVDSESEAESSADPEVPSRYYHKESKAIRCRNCKEIGHMARNCPNESKIPLCKYCGTQHGISDMCPAIK